MINSKAIVKPELPVPFPIVQDWIIDDKTGLRYPKRKDLNLEYRINILDKAEKDEGLQRDLLAACSESLLFWINVFVMTYHQWDIDPVTGKRFESKHPDEPMITWSIQDELFLAFQSCLENGEDILLDKSRDMGASWCSVDYIHWLMLFRPDSQLLEMSRNEDYVDKAGNMKALFQKHDYINKWLPDWMRSPGCFLGEKNRRHMHWHNPIINSTLDGESTTKHAIRGDRRLLALLDEFGAVQNGSAMRMSSRDAALVRIVNSTSVPGSEYNIWRSDKTIKVFVLPFHEHPEKGAGRYVKQTKTGKFQIRSPWLDREEKIRGPKYIATEVLREDTEPGLSFFTIENIEMHMALHVRPCTSRWDIKFKTFLNYEDTAAEIQKRNLTKIIAREKSDGPLRLWCDLIKKCPACNSESCIHVGRPDQTKSYIFGMDVSKGQGASNSVISIKCKDTGEKVGEWTSASYPPYEFSSIIVAIALWFGGPKPWKLPFLKWEKNGPGWDVGRIIVKKYFYPFYYRHISPGKIVDKKSKEYGHHTSQQSKEELLYLYDRMLAFGGYINHSKEALEEARDYIHYPNRGVGPARYRQESAFVKKAHGDRVIADALTLEDSDIPKARPDKKVLPYNSAGYRFIQHLKSGARVRGKKRFNFMTGALK